MARNVVIDIKAKTQQYERALKSATRNTESFGNKLGGIAKKGAALGSAAVVGGVIALGAAAVKVGLEAAKSFGEFEKSLAQIEGLVGVAHDEVVAMTGGLKELAVEAGRGPQELADALFFITSAGLEGADAMDALEVSAKAATAGLGDTATIADVVTSAMNAYGADVLDAAQSTDVLVATVREGKAAAPELSGALGQVIPIASSMGVAFHEVGAAIAAMTRTGLNAAEASTALKSILTSMLAPTSDAALAMEGLGLSAAGLQSQIRSQGLFATLQTLNEKFDGNTEATTRVFGNVRALTGVMSLMGSNAAATEEIFDSLSNSTGALDVAFGAAADTGAFAFEQAKTRIEVAMLDLGEQILPKLADAIDQIAPLLPELVEGIGNVSIAMVDFGVAAVPAMIGAFDLIGDSILDFQIGMLQVGRGIEASANFFDVLLGPLISIDDQFDATKASLQQWLVTQRTMNQELRDGAKPIDVAYRALAILGTESALTAERMAALQASLGLTPEEMLRAGEAAMTLAASLGATKDELRIMDSQLDVHRDAVQDNTTNMWGAAEAYDVAAMAAAGLGTAVEESTTAYPEAVSELSEFEAALATATEMQISLSDAIKHASDPAFKAVKAVKALNKAQADYNDLLAATGDEKATVEELAEAQLALVEATLGAQGALDATNPAALEAALFAIQTALGLSDDEARELLVTLGILDGAHVAMVLDVELKTSGAIPTGVNIENPFDAIDDAKHFALGGVVGGPIGRPQLAVVHGGEEVLTRRERMEGTTSNVGSGAVTVIINRPETNDLQGDVTAGLTMAGVVQQVDGLGGI